MDFRTLDDLDLADRRVLIRVDLNAPVSGGRVTDDTRLRAVAPTIRDVIAAGGRPILLAHFGRPKGKPVPEMSLAQIREALEAAIGVPVDFCPASIGDEAEAAAKAARPGRALLMENTRFHAGEEANDPDFAAALTRLGDVYVNDAFSAAHRAHASTEGLARLLPAAAGRLMQAELEALGRALETPARPVIAVVGGAKVSTKIELLETLAAKVDQIVIGGGMANTFLAAMGVDVGKSLCEHDMAETARDILKRADECGCEIILPSDVVIAPAFAEGAPSRVVPVDAVPDDQMILDIGPGAAAGLSARLGEVRTLLWNGPLGAFEISPFDAGTVAVAQAAAAATQAGGLLSVAGGGDTVAALNHAGVSEQFSYVSAAGGAFLEWLEGKTLPGVAALGG